MATPLEVLEKMFALLDENTQSYQFPSEKDQIEDWFLEAEKLLEEAEQKAESPSPQSKKMRKVRI
jgi:hypothetical protein